MQYYILAFAATLLLATDFSLNKLYQRRAGSSAAAGFAFNALCGIFTAIVFWAINGFKFEFTPFSLVMATAMATSVLLYSLAGLKMLSGGRLAVYTLFLMTGGMSLPYIFGLIFWNEPFSVLRTIGKNVYTDPHYFASEHEAEALYTPLHQPAAGAKFNRKNVVVIIIESFGKELKQYLWA